MIEWIEQLLLYLRYGLVQPKTVGMVGGTLQVAKALIDIYIPGFPKRKAQKNPQIHKLPPVNWYWIVQCEAPQL